MEKYLYLNDENSHIKIELGRLTYKPSKDVLKLFIRSSRCETERSEAYGDFWHLMGLMDIMWIWNE